MPGPSALRKSTPVQQPNDGKYAPLSTAYEGVPFTVYGHSYTNGAGKGVDQGTQFFYRLANRLRTQALVNYGASGYRMDQILGQIQATWAGNRRGFVGFGDGVINDVKQFNSASSGYVATTVEAFRSCLAYLTSWAIVPTSSFVYGPGWTSDSSSTAGSYVDIPIFGDSAYVLVSFVPGSGGAIIFKNTAGTTLATVTTGGYAQTFTGAVKITGLGSGAHTIRGTVQSGTVALAGVTIPSTIPPQICWFTAGPYNSVVSSNEISWMRNIYQPACAALLTDFLTVQQVDAGDSWNPATMVAPDGIHPNDLGELYITDRLTRALETTIPRQGLNQLTSDALGIYPAPVATYTITGATAPAAATAMAGATANQVNLTWLRGTDGGSTVTSQVVQISADAGSTWADLVTGLSPTFSSTTIATGLTQGSSYQFRIIAVNAIGRGIPSASSGPVTAGSLVTNIAADTFTRSDTTNGLGSTETGAFPWTYLGPGTGAYGIQSNAAYAASASAELLALFNDALADFTYTATMPITGDGTAGIVFRVTDANNYFLLYRVGTVWRLSQKTAASTYVVLANGSGTVANGDTLQVNARGSVITVKVNGTQVISVTNTGNQTATRKGLWMSTGATGSKWDNIATLA